MLPGNTVRAGKVASFRDVGDKNYYHFYNDHLVKLALLEKAGLPESTPLLVSKVLFDRPYFQEALSRTGLGKRCWIVQDREYVAAEGSYFLKTMPITREYLQYVLNMLGAPKPNPNKGRRIFIDRGENVGRCITNITEFREVLASFDFEAVTLDDMTLGDQMALFSEAGFVVGIHGAGLANIIFRAGEPMKVLEIFPPNNIPAMFYWISCTFGFDYDALVGEKSKWQRADRQQWAKVNFYVDPEALRAALNKMLRKK
jgi:capsular polysaccharide biosynthesis protein